MTDEGKACFGLRASGTVTPAMDLYFDKTTILLLRIDWRKDQHKFSNWKDRDDWNRESACPRDRRDRHRITGISCTFINKSSACAQAYALKAHAHTCGSRPGKPQR